MNKITVVLAVALPLLLCLLCLLVLLAFLFLRFRHYRLLIPALRDECAQLKSNLAAFPKAWDGNKYCHGGYLNSEVKESFASFNLRLEYYLEKWVDCDRAPMNESPARIKAILFPEILQPYPETPEEHLLREIPPEHLITAGKDLRLFPNPHQYTPSDISTLLERKLSREAISNHIIASTLIKAVSVDGNPAKTLLPFDPPEVYALHKIKSLIQGVELFMCLRTYISRFGFPYLGSKARYPGIHSTEGHVIDVFESLLEPYFTSNSQESVAQRKSEFEGVMEAAVQHGMKVIGVSHQTVEYRWGMRSDRAIMVYPALYMLSYRNMKLEFATELEKSASKGGCGI